VEAYLPTATYSPGGDNSLIETAANKAASECLDTAMLGKLSGDALALFNKTGSTYIKQGFKKLAALSLNMFDFSRDARNETCRRWPTRPSCGILSNTPSRQMSLSQR
jgi:hypothetical protein